MEQKGKDQLIALIDNFLASFDIVQGEMRKLDKIINDLRDEVNYGKS